MTNLIENKKVRLNYEILEDYEGGLELRGFEVKALLNKLGSLESTHVSVRGGEAYLLNSNIPPYQPANTPDEYDPARPRRILLSRDEIQRLKGLESRKGLTIVPISMYTKGRKIKVRIAVVRGKKKYDKRETLKKRTTEREIQRRLKVS